MPGRKNPKENESEREHEYVMAQKRGYGEEVVGTEAADLAEKGAVGEVEREREEYARKRDALREMRKK